MHARPLLCLLSALLCLFSLNCGASEGSERDADQGDGESSEDQGGTSSSDLLGGGGALAMGSVLAQAGKPGLYDEPRQSADFSAAEDHFVILELGGPVVELKSVSLLGGIDGTEIGEISGRLDDFAANDRVAGLILRVDGLSLGMPAAESLRRELISFKEEGERELHCHGETIENVGYVLLSACDTIGLAPTGQVMITGVAAMPVHLKGLLDKLGIKADFLHVGEYKGAAEPLTRERPSEAMEETLAGILDEGYETMVEAISAGRGMSADTVRSLIDKAVFGSEEAVSAKLVDQEAIFQAFRDDVVGARAWRIARLGADGKPGFGKLMELLGMSQRSRPSSDHVAVVHAVGNIIDGKGNGLIGARSEIAARTLSSTLRVLASAEAVKAVVLRVDSGGGSALASELIWHAVQEVKAKKPVVVSMGSVAASGGYYISSAANRIFAEETTLTGSIGVVGGKLAIEGALEKLGIRTYPMGRGEHALLWSRLGPWNAEERQLIHSMMERVYEVFVERVAAGRDMSVEEVRAIAQGRVWTGAAAREKGLVDEIGGLSGAIAHARELSGVSADTPLEVYPPPPNLMDIVSSFAGSSAGLGSSRMRTLLRQIEATLGKRAAETVATTLRQVLAFGDSPIQAALILPLLQGAGSRGASF